MVDTAPAQNKTVMTAAMIRRREVDFVVSDNMANSRHGWIFYEILHKDIAAKQVFIFRS